MFRKQKRKANIYLPLKLPCICFDKINTLSTNIIKWMKIHLGKRYNLVGNCLL